MITDPSFASWILASLSSGIVAIDGSGAVVMLNAGARDVLGCPAGEPEDALGSDCREVFASQPAVAHLLLGSLSAPAPVSRAELVLAPAGARPAGTIGFTLSSVRDDRDRVRGAAMFFRDLTPFERTDEQDRLRERLAALGQMAAGLAHEIRNPLAGMEVIAGLLKRHVADREAMGLVDQLFGELRALESTVDTGLAFVRPVALERSPVDATALVEEALAVAISRIPLVVQIERRYAPGLPQVEIDADRIRSVLTDLIVNAFQAMEGASGGAPRLTLGVEVQVAGEGDRAVRVESDGSSTAPIFDATPELVISIADTGPGVPPELAERIFYPFFTTRQLGSGVGLANAQKVLAGHGGIVEIDRARSVGAEFRVRLPVRGTGG
jgi:nitrogen-specific signal transduction histidine kinase